MTNRRIKKPVLYGIYALIFVTVIGIFYMVDSFMNKTTFNNDDNYDYVSDTVIEDDIPVVSNKEILVRPYNDANVTIKKDFYDYKATSEKQENSILFYQNTYIQNSGVAYGTDKIFDVLAVLDGTVTDVKEDELLGKIVEVKHENNVISLYQSLGEVRVKKGDAITKGTIIGKSGTSNISKDLGNHLHFELIINGNNVNPEEYYDKNVGEL